MRLFNAYPDTVEAYGATELQIHQDGDFLVHFAGCSMQSRRNCKKEWDSFLERTLRPPPPLADADERGAFVDARKCCLRNKTGEDHDDSESCRDVPCGMPPTVQDLSKQKLVLCLVRTKEHSLERLFAGDSRHLCQSWYILAADRASK